MSKIKEYLQEAQDTGVNLYNLDLSAFDDNVNPDPILPDLEAFIDDLNKSINPEDNFKESK